MVDPNTATGDRSRVGDAEKQFASHFRIEENSTTSPTPLKLLKTKSSPFCKQNSTG